MENTTGFLFYKRILVFSSCSFRALLVWYKVVRMSGETPLDWDLTHT